MALPWRKGFLIGSRKGITVSLPTRAADELRPIEFTLDYVMHPEGSVLIAAGNTRVLCNATVEEKLPPWLRYSDNRHVAAQHR